MYTLKFDGSLTGKTKKSNYAGDCAANMLTILDSYELIHIDRKYNKVCDAYSRYALDYGVII